jgi:hypothetical protein
LDQKTGWRLAAVYAAAFVGLITWYLPRELDHLRETIAGDTAATIQPLDRRLSAIEGELRVLAASKNPAGSLKEIAALSQKEFSLSLPAL